MCATALSYLVSLYRDQSEKSNIRNISIKVSIRAIRDLETDIDLLNLIIPQHSPPSLVTNKIEHLLMFLISIYSALVKNKHY